MSTTPRQGYNSFEVSDLAGEDCGEVPRDPFSAPEDPPSMTSPSALRLLPWPEIALPLARAEDALARLDERLRTSPIRDGWIARTHFADACAALLLEGQLVHIEDLVRHCHVGQE